MPQAGCARKVSLFLRAPRGEVDPWEATMIEDIFSGLLEGLCEFLFEMLGEVLNDVIGGIRDALSGGQSHRHEGGPVEKYKFLPKDSDG